MTGETLHLTATDAGPAVDIHRQLRGRIISGQLGAGERLPTVRQAAADLGVAPGTVAKAYKMLEVDGLVVSRTAAGTRVAASAAVLPLPVLTRIRELAESAADAGADADDVLHVLRITLQENAGQSAPVDAGP